MSVQLLQEMAHALEIGTPAVVATIVRTRGSTPRKTGSKMLVRSDGSVTGTICGGCVEAEVYAESLEVMETGECRLLSFRLTPDDAEELGMKCGGSMEIFIEPLARPLD